MVCVYLSVCLSVTRMYCAKTAEPMEVPFWGRVGLTHVNPRYHGLDIAPYRSAIMQHMWQVSFVSELLKLRDNYLYFSGHFHLDQVDIATLIDYVATSTV